MEMQLQMVLQQKKGQERQERVEEEHSPGSDESGQFQREHAEAVFCGKAAQVINQRELNDRRVEFIKD